MLKKIVEILQDGGIIAYPTEAVYGLGCDPFNELAVQKLLRLKQRKVGKGVILVAADWSQVEDLIGEVDAKLLAKPLKSWPGPVTWVFPASAKVPSWVRGEHDSVAIRLSAHKTVQDICNAFAGPIVSTSANIAGHNPARTYDEVLEQFPKGIDLIVKGEVEGLAKPTPIYDVLTGKIFRS